MKDDYVLKLKLIGSLSRLFSESSKPFLYYRIAEHLYIKCFNATDVTRNDIAIDTILDDVGIGLKTFQGHKGKASYQKVAEFNKKRSELEQTRTKLGDLGFINQIAKLRNDRIQFVANTFKINEFKYHCVVRNVGMFSIHEEEMVPIDIDTITLKKVNSSTIHFKDNKNEYTFSLSKSTLLKKFSESHPLYSFQIQVLADPLEVLLEKLSSFATLPTAQISSIVLPLYSTKLGTYGRVPESSGLNQWNADGRPRDLKEVYIPIPAIIHKIFPGFLPPRGQTFNIQLPDGSTIPVSVAQDGAKALMSNPNSLLGEWLISGALSIRSGQIVTRELLDNKGVDSVEVSKIDGEYFLSLKKTGSYEKFIDANA